MIALDYFELRLFFRADPMADWPTVRALLEVLARIGGPLAPATVLDEHRRPRPLVLDELAVQWVDEPATTLELGDEDAVYAELHGYPDERDPSRPSGNFRLWAPWPVVAGAVDRIVPLVTAIDAIAPLIYGWGHSHADVGAAADPSDRNPHVAPAITQVYWLTVLGAPLVAPLGIERVRATPAARIEVTPAGTVVIVTSDDPARALEPAAREAQARALVHLRPELDRAAVRAQLDDRSREIAEDAEDAEDAAGDSADDAGGEATDDAPDWLPAAAAPPSDVDDPAAAIEHYLDEAETFEIGFHTRIPGLLDGEPAVLARIEDHFFEQDVWGHNTREVLDRVLLPTLGAYLGKLLVDHLGGRWVPRRDLREVQVVVGDRAWLPFVRAARFLRSRRAAAAHSFEAWFEAAAAHAGPRAGG